ncbi:phospho-sugar mutase [Clostridium thermopalmarium]|uniref:Phosphoglucomutase n=1 Tax=Clostridium thermopalmarium DSM 5974 TaxID=1121340 RepID=A0A2T0AXD4_9CLOT|nr:phospho-sugar mutase [Clostridium thermopalmarium]PRR75471.1 Phosphoglucomutase [Clostridium thermopalmarium DSM 5974]PVZ24373.1 phosphoglucomutase [Clostridium thermopalmarium DSM 5974]
MDYLEKYNTWLNSKIIDEKTKEELRNISEEKELEDRFYKDLEFGTGGLRGIIGAGSNRMNVYTVGKATQGLAEYLLNKYYDEDISVSIAYDSRNMSKEFAEFAALTLCANGIKVNLFESLRPTPILSYTVRYLKSKAGIVITASHNPKEYNGYKVYGEDGGQVTDDTAKEILSFINNIDDFSKIKFIDMDEAKKSGLLRIIGEEVDNAYIDKVKNLSIRKDLVKEKAKELKIIYTPLHGTGNIPVRRVLKELGYENVHVVKEQEMPDGNFPTAEYPNPEESKVFNLALKMAEEIEPDIIFGTDPDCDRIGAVVKDNRGEYKVLTGNMMGALLTEYILSSLKEKGSLPKNGVVIKTIVTTDMTAEIAKSFNVEVIDVLTGFKYIGEKIKEFERTGEKSYIFGFEESYGYLAGTFVRDKDAVIASMLICEMALYYKQKGMSLYDGLMNLYDKYGFFKEELVSIKLEGKDGQEKIWKILEHLRHSMKSDLNGTKIVRKLDYKKRIEKNLITLAEYVIDLPESNVLKFILEDDSSFVVRPSGTEPKMKIYLSVKGNSITDAKIKMNTLKESVMEIINNSCNQ